MTAWFDADDDVVRYVSDDGISLAVSIEDERIAIIVEGDRQITPSALAAAWSEILRVLQGEP
jgi:hypothetical protein